MKKNWLLLVLTLLLLACNTKNKEIPNAKKYFDLASYFNTEAVRLTKNQPTIYKTVSINGITEQKKIKRTNWVQEFASFNDAAINKASWLGQFKTIKNKNKVMYIAQNNKIPVKKLEITYANNKVQSVFAVVITTNSLYTSTDTLAYYPDSIYEFIKHQKVKLFTKKVYKIFGKTEK